MPLDISGVITSRGTLQVGPRRFGAGPVELLISDQGTATTTVELVGPGVSQRARVAPGGLETLDATMRPGRYRIRATSPIGTRSVVLEVGPLRPSPQNRVDLP